MTKLIIPFLFIAVLILAVVYLVIQNLIPGVYLPINETRECTNEAKICPDGSAVGRTGPNCEFAACPAEPSPSTSSPSASEQITVSGTMICLPHRNTDGPQTLECALGLQGDDNKNYGLNDPGWKFLIGTPNGVKVKITGAFTPKEDQKYNSVGVIEISNLERL